MGIITTLLVGLVVGIVAKLLTPGKDPGGCLLTSLLGVAGSALGSYAGQWLGLYRVGEPAGFIGAVVGAVAILLILRAVTKR